MDKKINLDDPRNEKVEQSQLFTSNTTHSSKKHEKKFQQETPFAVDNVIKPKYEASQTIKPLPNEMFRRNKEVNESTKNNILTTCVLIKFSEHNKKFKGGALQYYEF